MNKKNGKGTHHEAQPHELVTEIMRRQVIERPYQTLAAALGVGFFIGAALWKQLGRSALGWGANLAITSMLGPLSAVDDSKGDGGTSD